ncbi:MAG: biliverdin-producing heme oxygenase [Rhodobacteraceae bacterium]|nr:biliverdin-producing heme oxygenase [Paracoccaceae bacterium]
MQNTAQHAPLGHAQDHPSGNTIGAYALHACSRLVARKATSVCSAEHVLTSLKHATSDAHASIEAVPRLAALQSSALDLQEYAETLQRYHAHYSAYEPGIFALLARSVPMHALQLRRRTDLIARDLACPDVDGAPVPLEAPPASLAEAAGWFYVHEGASLGGRVILRSLRETLGATCHGATAFLDCYGKNTGSVWRESRAIISGLIRDKRDLTEAIGGANAAFASLAMRMR